MDTPLPADKSPFLAPYPPPAGPTLPTLKPFTAVDLAPPLGAGAARMPAPPQVSPFLDKQALPAQSAKPVILAAPPPEPPGPVPSSDLSRLFAPPAAAASPFAGKPVMETAAAAPAPAAREERPVPAAVTPTIPPVQPPAPPARAAAQPDAAAPVPAAPAQSAATQAMRASATARPASASAILRKTDLAMTDADAPAEKPDVLVTTGPLAQGRDILSYHGVVSVELVIPKDLLFRNPAPYGELHRIKAAEEQLQRVKQKAFEELSERARALGANGIIGATMQFSQFDAVVFLCSALGTAVKLAE